MSHREYLGDGVYADFDGFQIWLEAAREGRLHRIALDDATFTALLNYNKWLRRELKKDAK